MLIQAAVGLLHFERGNVRGAHGMHKNVMEKLALLPRVFMSLDIVEFEHKFREYFAPLQQGNWEAIPEGYAPTRIRLRSVEENK